MMSRLMTFGLKKYSSELCIFSMSFDRKSVRLTGGVLWVFYVDDLVLKGETKCHIGHGSPSAVISHEEPGACHIMWDMSRVRTFPRAQ